MEKIIKEIELLQNPLIKGEYVDFDKVQFQKIPIMYGRFIVFLRIKNDAEKEIFYIKSAKVDYYFSIC
jgi:hypothetical protein